MIEVEKGLAACPLIAILRGIETKDALAVGKVLLSAGFGVLEVPLNSPNAFDTIALMARTFDQAVVGAGTVLSTSDVDRSAAAGARLILSPNTNLEVIAHACQQGLFSMPGVATASEAFAAIQAGAHALKLFPADLLGPATVRAWKAVLPRTAALYAVGGVDASNLIAFRAAGVHGAGLGSSLFFPGIETDELRGRADALMNAWTSWRIAG